MKAVLGWLKSHVLIVVFGFLILLLPPAGVVGSMMWNDKIRAGAEELYNDEQQKIDRAGRVNYEVPAIVDGEQPPGESRAPNTVVSRAYHAERERRQAEIEAVVRSAVEFNRGDDRTVLVEGLFPDAPEGAEGRRLIDAFVERIVGTEDAPGVYDALFDAINAGDAPESVDVARAVSQFRERELDRLVGSDDVSALTDEQREELNEALVSFRIAQYRQRADEVSVYATSEVLHADALPEYSSIPSETPEARPGIDAAFIMQMDFWAVEDLLAAIARANTEAGGLLTEVPRSSVKRIESIRIHTFDKAIADEDGSAAGSIAAPPGFGQPRAPSRGPTRRGGGGPMGPAEQTPSQSHTGRDVAENDLFDARTIELEAVVASDRVVDIFDALAATNFMTVTRMAATEVDIWEDLNEGYFYGGEHVVKLSLSIESIWLRQWTRDAMPEVVRNALGVVLPEPNPEEVPEEEGEVSP